ALEPAAGLPKAGRAPNAALDGGGVGTVGASKAGIGAGVDTNDGSSRGGGQVKRTGIVRDEEVGLLGQGGKLEQGRLAAQIQQRQGAKRDAERRGQRKVHA